MKKKSAVVFCFTGNLAFAVASVIMDMKRLCADSFDEVVCIHDGKLKRKDQEALQRITTVRFIRYVCPLKDLSAFNQDTLRYFTYMVFSKFECLRLLDDYHTVMFMDYDVVVTKSLAHLYEGDGANIKMLLDGTVRTQLHPDSRHLELEGIDMEGTGMCASLFVLKDTLPDYRGMYDFVYEITQRHAPYLYGIEQFAFSVMLQKFQLLQVEALPGLVYSLHPNDMVHRNQAAILHAYGQPKFWNGLYDEQWQKNYAQWQSLGGSKFKPAGLGERILRKIACLIKGKR